MSWNPVEVYNLFLTILSNALNYDGIRLDGEMFSSGCAFLGHSPPHEALPSLTVLQPEFDEHQILSFPALCGKKHLVLAEIKPGSSRSTSNRTNDLSMASQAWEAVQQALFYKV